MALQEATIPIDFGQGFDSKTDPKMVVEGKLLVLRDAIFTAIKQLRKRNGYSVITSTFVAPSLVKAFNNECIVADSGILYSYSPGASAWARKGSYVSTDVSTQLFWKQQSVGPHVDTATNGVYTVSIWNNSPIGANNNFIDINVYAQITDAVTGAILVGPTILGTIASSGGNPVSASCRAFLVGASTLGVSYISTGGIYACRTINAPGAGTLPSFNTETNLCGDVGIGDALPSYNYDATWSGITHVVPVDAATTSTGAVIACPRISAGAYYGFRVTTINTNGAIVNTIDVNDSLFAGPLFISVESGGNIWVHYGVLNHAGNVNSIWGIILSSTLSVVTSAHLEISEANTSAHILSICAIMSVSTSTNNQTVWYSVVPNNISNSTSSLQDSVPITKSYSITNAFSAPTVSTWQVNVVPCSHPFVVNNVTYGLFYSAFLPGVYNAVSSAPIEASYHILNLSGGSTVYSTRSDNSSPSIARLFTNIATPVYVNYSATGGFVAPSFMCLNATSLTSTKILLGASVAYQTVRVAQGTTSGVNTENGAAYAIVDFASNRSYKSITSGNLAILNGACVQMYDGQVSCELGFHNYPIIVSSSTSGGGSIGAGTYTYYAVYQWTDAQGNLHQSGVSNPWTVTVGASSTVTLTFTACSFTQKNNVNIAIYRTQAGGSNYYLVTDPIEVILPANATTTTTFADSLADVYLPSRPLIYTNGGIVSNDPPPAALLMESRYNRLILVNAETPNTLYYSKTFVPGTGISMSDQFILNIDPKYGAITAINEMDEKLVISNSKGFLVLTGDGGNDTGLQSTWSFPQDTPSDTGFDNHKSVILTPVGLIGHTPKGMYLLDRSMNLQYLGTNVEGFNSNQIISATYIADKNQIRFLSSNSQYCLVYDYLLNQWSTFSNHQGTSADIFQNLFTYARTDGKIYQESTTSFLDNTTSYAMYAQTAWIKLAGVQGFQRVRRVALLGDYTNGSSASHGIQISVAYDFSTSFTALPAYTFGASSSSGQFQYRERTVQQKCDSICLLIQEVTDSGVSAEFIDLSNLSLEAGLKKGINKNLSSSQSL